MSTLCTFETRTSPALSRSWVINFCLCIQHFWGCGTNVLHVCILVAEVPYSGKFSREKTFVNWWKIWFLQKKIFRGLLALPSQRMLRSPNFTEKTFPNSHKTTNLRKCSPLKESRYTVCASLEIWLGSQECFSVWGLILEWDYHIIFLVPHASVCKWLSKSFMTACDRAEWWVSAMILRR